MALALALTLTLALALTLTLPLTLALAQPLLQAGEGRRLRWVHDLGRQPERGDHPLALGSGLGPGLGSGIRLWLAGHGRGANLSHVPEPLP